MADSFMGYAADNKSYVEYKMKVINVGSIPPPYGGVAVHIERLMHFLEERNENVLLIDISKQKKAQKNVINKNELGMLFHLLFKEKRAIVHFHIFSVKLIFLFFLVSLKHKTIITLHNERFLATITSGGEFLYSILKILLNRFDVFIVLNDKCKQLAEQFVVKQSKIKLISNYIPREYIEPMRNETILSVRAKYEYLLSSNAWDIRFHNGFDLYGIDLLIEMMRELVGSYNVALIFLLPRISDREYYDKLLKKIEAYQLKGRFYIITEAVNGTSLWKISDIVIRATNTDGNSISVMEAIDVGTPVLASDCVERPKSVVLFKTRDVDDMIKKVRLMLDNITEYKERSKIPLPNAGDEILNIYKSLQ